MFHLLPTLKSAFPFIGERPATDLDLFKFCESFDINLVFTKDVPIGVYALSEGHHFILLNPSLYGWSLLYVFCHEIGHYMFHSPSQSNIRLNFQADCRRRKNHLEAEYVAALLLLPLSSIEQYLIEGTIHENEDLACLIATRLEIYKQFSF